MWEIVQAAVRGGAGECAVSAGETEEPLGGAVGLGVRNRKW